LGILTSRRITSGRILLAYRDNGAGLVCGMRLAAFFFQHPGGPIRDPGVIIDDEDTLPTHS
jgi:hypothetical protein